MFIKMDNACKNKQGDGGVAEKQCQNIFVTFVTLWLNLCDNNHQTCFFIAVTFASFPGTWQILMHEKKSIENLECASSK